ncbi:HEPN family nuclease [Entomomonas asaccharolytica]|uniref:pEK499-p136 HEPN domain-containing protein n=1 Tax=Entomomonas asaccharolytica TaxID=2785331 RepID=A0A974RWR7_9GAMM|nr:HEPN family nuclease [Entomomonas asaccharolytica]QQP85473.1 hypothetical protein JHT90_14035 [Entomomonas asaccharolytica]
MTEYTNIKIDFISRTKDILNNLQERTENDVTLLLNCCLGLLALPSQIHSGESLYQDIFNKNLEDIFNDYPHWGLKKCFIKKLPDNKEYKLKDLIRRIRNGICHFHIEAICVDSNIIEKLNIKDRYNNNPSFDFEIELSVTQLKKFAIKLADEILNTNK